MFGIWLWAHWNDISRQMDEAFPLFEKWGIAGVKIDFMDRDDQWMVNFYRRVLKKAADHHLMIDFHGAFKPDGIERTWPNLMTREGIMGAEYNKWSARVTPDHNRDGGRSRACWPDRWTIRPAASTMPRASSSSRATGSRW